MDVVDLYLIAALSRFYKSQGILSGLDVFFSYHFLSKSDCFRLHIFSLAFENAVCACVRFADWI